MPILNINNAEIYYELQGSGQPLVLISGIMGDHTVWEPIVDELVKDYQVLIFDNRGVGQTKDDGQDFTVETMADDVFAICETLNFKHPHVVGSSFGGMVAQMLAKKHGKYIKTLTLSNTFPKVNSSSSILFSYISKLHELCDPPSSIYNAVIPWVFSDKFLTPEVIDTIRTLSDTHPYPQSKEDYIRQLNAMSAFDSSDWVSSISIPTLVLGSEQDRVAPPEESIRLAKLIPAAELSILPGGHVSQMEHQSFFVELLRKFHKII